MEMPIIMRNSGTADWQGIEYNFVVRDGQLFLDGMGSFYSLYADTLIITRVEFGYTSRQVFKRVN